MLAIKKQHVHKMSVAKMRILRWISGNEMNDSIQNKEIRLKIGITLVDEKMRRSCLRWFVHVQSRAITALVGKMREQEEVEEDLK